MDMSELCQELRNWFCADSDIHSGTYSIVNGALDLDFLKEGQYYRIVGSVFNDGVHKNDFSAILKDETFTGAIWAMRVPPSFEKLVSDIGDWIEKNRDASMSPYQSESWGGYSYSLKTGSDSGVLDWRTAFASSLNRWRKL